MKKRIFLMLVAISLLLWTTSCQNQDKTTPPTTTPEPTVTPEMLKTASKLLESIKKLERQGRAMEPLRRNQTIENLKECGQEMRERQRVSDDLRAATESLPMPLRFQLGVAATESKLCVSCLPSARESCDRVKSALVEAKKVIEEVSKDVKHGTGDSSQAQKPSQSDTNQDGKKEDSIETIGKWRDESEPSIMNSTIEIYRQSGKYHLRVKFDKDGSTANEELRKESPRQFRRISHPGDYYVITENGYLESRDKEGVIFTARPVR